MTAYRSGRRLSGRGLTDAREKLQALRREPTEPGVGGYCMKHSASFLLALLFSHQAFAECVEGDCTNGQGHMKYDDGTQYIGQWKDGMPNGQGRLTNPDTSIKEGLWSNGQFVDGGSSPE